MKLIFSVIALATLAVPSSRAHAEELPTTLKQQMEVLSTSMTPTGGGWARYAEILHSAYSRSNDGKYETRSDFIEGLRQWWNAGMRVQSREVTPVAADIAGEIAVVRSRFSEHFVDNNNNESGGFSGFVTNVWVRHDGHWKLLTAIVESE